MSNSIDLKTLVLKSDPSIYIFCIKVNKQKY